MEQRYVEHEATVITGMCAVKESQVKGLSERQRAFEEKIMQEELRGAQRRAAAGTCPLSTGADAHCKLDACAWYTGTGCAQGCPHPATGKKCPVNNNVCAADCAWVTTD